VELKEQDRQNRIVKPGCQDRTDKMGLAELDRQKKTAGKGQPGRDLPERTARKGLPGQERTSEMGQAE
jgi:hypothetical protein